MNNLLFLCQPTVGHLNTLLSIGLQARADGHAVRFLLPGVQVPRQAGALLQTAADVPRRIAAHGLAVDLLRPALSQLGLAAAVPLSATSGYSELALAVLLFSSGLAHYTRGILRHLERQRPDMLVTDFAFLASALAADSLGLPYVTVYHSGLPFRGPGIPPFGSGLPIGETDSPRARAAEARERWLLRLLDGAVNRARRKLGLTAVAPDILRRPYSPWLNLITSDPAIEAPRELGDAPTLFVGPCFTGRSAGGAETFPVELLRAERRVVYVSLGTVFNNRPKLLQTLLTALGQPDLQVIVSAGAAYDALCQRRLPTNAQLFRTVPQTELLPRVDVFISHGGNNSTNEALAAGVPLLVIPIGGEQGDNASRVAYLGVGLRAEPATLTADTIRRQVRRLLDEPCFRTRAQQCAGQLPRTPGAQVASAAIRTLGDE